MRPYSEAVKADVRRRMSPPQRQSVARIAEELGIHVITLYKWRKAWRLQGEVVPATEKVTWTPKTEPALMRASLSARLGQEKPHETQTPQPRAGHPQAENC